MFADEVLLLRAVLIIKKLVIINDWVTKLRTRLSGPLFMVGMLVAAQALAAEPVKLTLKNNRFVSPAVTAPAGERLRIEVENQDPTPAEFESSDLRVEKFIAPGGRIIVMVGPLKPGSYKFFDEYHPDTAVGILTAVAKPE
ncbi:MAG: cupredoxin domain-containing protein [Reyranella sp.]|nr:cupredoxin domain-containing protein [Reyranella sp.]